MGHFELEDSVKPSREGMTFKGANFGAMCYIATGNQTTLEPFLFSFPPLKHRVFNAVCILKLVAWVLHKLLL